MRRHDLTNKKTMKKANTKTNTNKFSVHLQRACDILDIWSEWWWDNDQHKINVLGIVQFVKDGWTCFRQLKTWIHDLTIKSGIISNSCDVKILILKQIWCIILDDPVFIYSGGSSTTMTPASCLKGEHQSKILTFLTNIKFQLVCKILWLKLILNIWWWHQK